MATNLFSNITFSNLNCNVGYFSTINVTQSIISYLNVSNNITTTSLNVSTIFSSNISSTNSNSSSFTALSAVITNLTLNSITASTLYVSSSGIITGNLTVIGTLYAGSGGLLSGNISVSNITVTSCITTVSLNVSGNATFNTLCCNSYFPSSATTVGTAGWINMYQNDFSNIRGGNGTMFANINSFLGTAMNGNNQGQYRIEICGSITNLVNTTSYIYLSVNNVTMSTGYETSYVLTGINTVQYNLDGAFVIVQTPGAAASTNYFHTIFYLAGLANQPITINGILSLYSTGYGTAPCTFGGQFVTNTNANLTGPIASITSLNFQVGPTGTTFNGTVTIYRKM